MHSIAALAAYAPLVSYYVTYAVALRRMQLFLRDSSEIRSPAELSRYERFVRGQMLAALIVMAHMPIFILTILTGLAPPELLIAMLPVAVASKWVVQLEQACRTVPTAPALSSRYDEISRIWQTKAWPKFPAYSSDEASKSSGPAIHCETHGDVGAAKCARCGVLACNACFKTARLAQALCSSCHASYEQLREQNWPRERLIRVSGLLMQGLGICELTVAIVMATFVRDALGGFVPWLGLVLMGCATSAVGYSLMMLSSPSRRISVALALPHLALFPVGTIATCVTLYALLTKTDPDILSSSYGQVTSYTAHRGFGYLWVSLLVAVLLVPLNLGGMLFLLSSAF